MQYASKGDYTGRYVVGSVGSDGVLPKYYNMSSILGNNKTLHASVYLIAAPCTISAHGPMCVHKLLEKHCSSKQAYKHIMRLLSLVDIMCNAYMFRTVSFFQWLFFLRCKYETEVLAITAALLVHSIKVKSGSTSRVKRHDFPCLDTLENSILDAVC